MAAVLLILSLALASVCYLYGNVVGKQIHIKKVDEMLKPVPVYPIHTMDKV